MTDRPIRRYHSGHLFSCLKCNYVLPDIHLDYCPFCGVLLPRENEIGVLRRDVEDLKKWKQDVLFKIEKVERDVATFIEPMKAAEFPVADISPVTGKVLRSPVEFTNTEISLELARCKPKLMTNVYASQLLDEAIKRLRNRS